jgi:hypothetical protein
MGRGSEGEVCLIENNMLGDDDVIGGEIKAPIAFVIGRVSEEDTSGGPGCQFIRCLGRGWDSRHNQTLTSAHRRGDTVESDIGVGCADRLVGKMVQQIYGSVEPFYLVAS